MKTTIILPVYNERENLEKNFAKVYRFMKRAGDFEIIIAEDGSTDGSSEIARRFAKLESVRLISSRRRLGRGGALKRAIRIASGGIIGYIDVDLATPLRFIPDAVEKARGGCDVVFGSRYDEGSYAKRTLSRFAGSKAYNFLLWAFFGSRIRDHQCGFKFWRREYIKQAVRQVEDNHWFFDSEMLIRAKKAGAKVCALPVEWHENRKTKVRLTDVLYFIRKILRLKASLRNEHSMENGHKQ